MKLTYNSYLQLEKILEAQKPLSRPASNDELLFICIHQVFEIWFKVIIRELDETIKETAANQPLAAVPHIKRITGIAELFPHQVRVLESMSPQSFLTFRDHLQPASGLQSLQFRRIEFLLGAIDERYLHIFPPPEARQLSADGAKNLWKTFMELLRKKYGMPTKSPADQEEAIKVLYSNTEHHALREFCEALVELDESFLKWRHSHALLAERMIGYKSGTGREDVKKITNRPFESGGVAYLREAAGKKCFPVLWKTRTFIA